MKPIKLKIDTKSQKYPIIIGSNLVSNLSNIAKNNSVDFKKCLLIVDKNISKKIISRIKKSLSKKKLYIYIFNANEKNKNQKNVNKILNILLAKNFSRNDCVISIGGGITGDVAGFAAAPARSPSHYHDCQNDPAGRRPRCQHQPQHHRCCHSQRQP